MITHSSTAWNTDGQAGKAELLRTIRGRRKENLRLLITENGAGTYTIFTCRIRNSNPENV